MVKTKGIGPSMKNWTQAIGAVPEKYKAGVQGNTNQNENAIAAEGLYAAKMQESIANQSRAKGLARSSTEAWKKAAIEKGAARIATGMTAATSKMQAGLTNVLATIEATSIGERTADPMANVDNRVKPLVRALHDMKRR